MRLFADECVYAVTTNTLRNWGHDVLTAQEAGLSGHADEDLLAFATTEKRILISIDLDFSNIRHYLPASHSGIVILKIRPTTVNSVHTILHQFIAGTSEADVQRSLVIVDRNKYRVRR